MNNPIQPVSPGGPAEGPPLSFLAGGGEMGERIRAYDWAATPLGAPAGWPQSLRSMVGLLLTTGHPMFIWWGPELIQFYNDPYRATMGPERHPSALGQRGRECWAEIWHIIGPQVEQVMAGGPAVWQENALVPVTRHGRLENVWWTYSYSPINDEAGGVGGVLVVCTDVTAQRETLLALSKSEERLQFALEAGGGVGTWDWDIPADRVYADPHFAALFSIDAQAARAGVPIANFFASMHAEDRARVEGEIAEVMAHGGDFAGEYRVIGADGASRWVLARGRCTLDSAGKPLRFPGVAVDTTEQHRAIAALEEADRRKDEFLAMLGHELRNPLSPILTAVAILERGEQVGWDGVARARGVIDRQARHLREIVDELLDVARITSGKISLKKDYVEIASAVHRAVEQTGELIEKQRHQLTISLPREPVYVIGDLPRLTQVFANLLGNAAKYTEPGGAISLTATPEDGGLRLCVRDNGMGIVAAMLPQVFDLFTQSRRALDRSQGGLGVGLTVVRRLVELHGGSVSADSAGQGQGSEFSVWLPVVTPQAGSHGGGTPLAAGSARRIMVVDDNRDAADMLGAVLGMEGHAVHIIYTGLDVLAEARAFRPEIILLDLGLPGLSGYEVAKVLRASPDFSGATLIALTGYGQEEDRRQSRAHGFDHHLVKPVNLEALAALIAAPDGH